MTPAEHVAEAERLLELAATGPDDDVDFLLRAAQVHATLATVVQHPAPPENVTGWLYCLCPWDTDGVRVADNTECPVHGEASP